MWLDEVAQPLLRRAEELWGPERLEELRPVLLRTAEHLQTIRDHPPDALDGPACSPGSDS